MPYLVSRPLHSIYTNGYILTFFIMNDRGRWALIGRQLDTLSGDTTSTASEGFLLDQTLISGCFQFLAIRITEAAA